MIGSKNGLIGRINSKMSELNLSPPIEVHCIIYQQALKCLCGKFLDLENVMSIIVQFINFIRSYGLNHC